LKTVHRKVLNVFLQRTLIIDFKIFILSELCVFFVRLAVKKTYETASFYVPKGSFAYVKYFKQSLRWR
jgi:hypothetical protein